MTLQRTEATVHKVREHSLACEALAMASNVSSVARMLSGSSPNVPRARKLLDESQKIFRHVGERRSDA